MAPSTLTAVVNEAVTSPAPETSNITFEQSAYTTWRNGAIAIIVLFSVFCVVTHVASEMKDTPSMILEWKKGLKKFRHDLRRKVLLQVIEGLQHLNVAL